MNKIKINKLSFAIALAVLMPLGSMATQSTQSPQSPQSPIKESTASRLAPSPFSSELVTGGTEKSENKINERSFPERGMTLPDAATVVIYKYKDDQGRVHYTDTPPKQYQAKAKVVDTKARESIISVENKSPQYLVSSSVGETETDWKAKDREFRERQETRQKLEKKLTKELNAVRQELEQKESKVKTEPTEEDYERLGRAGRRLSPDFSARQEALKSEIEELKNKEKEIRKEINSIKT